MKNVISMKKIEDSLTICKLLFKSRKYVELIKYCDELLEKYPENEKILFFKGDSLFYLEKYKKALECYSKLLEINPFNIDYVYSKSETLTHLSRNHESAEIWEESLKKVNFALKINPNNPNNWFFKSKILERNYRYLKEKEALHAINKAINLDSSNPEYYYLKSDILTYQSNDEKEALNEINNALKLDPYNINYLMLKAHIFEHIRKYDDAIKVYNLINSFNDVDVNNYIVDCYLSKSEICKENNDYENALVYCDIALMIVPNNKNALLRKLDFYKEFGDFKMCILIYDKLIENNIFHYSAKLYYLEKRAETLYEKENLNESYYCYKLLSDYYQDNKDKILENMPWYFWSYSEWYDKVLHDCIDNYDKKEFFNHIYEITEETFDLWYKKMKMLDEYDESDKIIYWCDKLLKIKPNHIKSLYLKGNALVHLEKYDEALKYFNKVLSIDKDNEDVIYSKLSVFYDLRNYDEFKKYYETVKYIKIHLGKIFENFIEYFKDKKDWNNAYDCCYEYFLRHPNHHNLRNLNRLYFKINDKLFDEYSKYFRPRKRKKFTSFSECPICGNEFKEMDITYPLFDIVDDFDKWENATPSCIHYNFDYKIKCLKCNTWFNKYEVYGPYITSINGEKLSKKEINQINIFLMELDSILTESGTNMEFLEIIMDKNYKINPSDLRNIISKLKSGGYLEEPVENYLIIPDEVELC